LRRAPASLLDRDTVHCVVGVAALSQIRYPDRPGRIYFARKIAEGKTSKEAFRALKRRISDAVYRQLLIDAKTR